MTIWNRVQSVLRKWRTPAKSREAAIPEKHLLEAALNRGPASSRVGELADHNYCTVKPDTEVSVLSDLLRKYRIALVMDDEGSVENVLTRIDLIDHVARMTT